MSERVQIGIVEISRTRVYVLDPLIHDNAAQTEVVVQPGTYPVFQRGFTTYWQMTGSLNGRSERLGDGMFTMNSSDAATPDEVTFYSRRFGPDEWAEMLSEAAVPDHALTFHLEQA